MTNIDTQTNIVVHVPPNGDSQQEQIERRFPKKKIRSTAINHLVWAATLALMMIIFHLSDSITFQVHIHQPCLGIMDIVFCALTGGIGLIAASLPSTGTLISYMVLSILTSVFVLPVMIMDGIFGLLCWINWAHFFICLAEEINAISTAVFCVKAAYCIVETSEGAVLHYNPSIEKSTKANANTTDHPPDYCDVMRMGPQLSAPPAPFNW